jgi:hypothetical protein
MKDYPVRTRLVLAAAALAAIAAFAAISLVRSAVPAVPADVRLDVVFAHTTERGGVSAVTDEGLAALIDGAGSADWAPIATPGAVTAPSQSTDASAGSSGRSVVAGSACLQADVPAGRPRICYSVVRLAETLSDRDLYLLSVDGGGDPVDAFRWGVVQVEPQMAAVEFTPWPDGVIDGPCGVLPNPVFSAQAHCGRSEGHGIAGGGWRMEWACSDTCTDDLRAGKGPASPLMYVVSVAEGTAPDWRILARFGS